MLATFLIVLTAALFDSASTAQQVLFLVMLFATHKPFRNSTAYILGIFIAYILCGVVGLLFIDKLNAWIHSPLMGMQNTDARTYKIQLFFGIILLILGPLSLRQNNNKNTSIMFERLKRKITPITALIFGAVISSTSAPMALPYLGALEKIHKTVPQGGMQFLFLLLYNIIYLVPMLIPFGIYFFFHKETDELESRLKKHAERINTTVTALMFAGVGLYFIIDSLYFAWAGKPLFNSSFF